MPHNTSIDQSKIEVLEKSIERSKTEIKKLSEDIANTVPRLDSMKKKLTTKEKIDIKKIEKKISTLKESIIQDQKLIERVRFQENLTEEETYYIEERSFILD